MEKIDQSTMFLWCNTFNIWCNEDVIDVDGDYLKTLLKIYLMLVKRFTLLVISLVTT